jgi:hypothetical protein
MTTYAERVLQQGYAWMRGHPRAADGGLAVLLFAASAGQFQVSPVAVAVGVALVTLGLAAAVAMRRPDPVLAFGIVAVIAAAQAIVGFAPNGDPPAGPWNPPWPTWPSLSPSTRWPPTGRGGSP